MMQNEMAYYEKMVQFHTPIEKITAPTGATYYAKREDLFEVNGVNGGKTRQALRMLNNAKRNGCTQVVTAGGRQSPQINIIAHVAHLLNMTLTAHAPCGELGDELVHASLYGAKIIQHKGGYNNVLAHHAKKQAQETGALYVPFGMREPASYMLTAQHVARDKRTIYAHGIKRIVICAVSGVNLAGVLQQFDTLPVLAVRVGADPLPTVRELLPTHQLKNLTIVDAGVKYSKEIKNNVWHGIKLDPIYEAKCVPFLEDGDLFWIIGLRQSAGTPTPVRNEIINKEFCIYANS